MTTAVPSNLTCSVIVEQVDIFMLGKLKVKEGVYFVCVIFPEGTVVKTVEKFRSVYSLNTFLHSDFSSSEYGRWQCCDVLQHSAQMQNISYANHDNGWDKQISKINI